VIFNLSDGIGLSSFPSEKRDVIILI